MQLWSSEDAARRLGLSSRRVRALARAGRLEAHKVGARWLVELAAAREPRPGRPVSSGTAWAMLAAVSGELPGWIHPSALSRLRRRMIDHAWVLESLKRSAARARIVRWRVLPSDIPKILGMPGLVLTGHSAVTDAVDLVPSSGELDAYVKLDTLRSIERQFRPAKAPGQPNLTLRVPTHPWVLGFRQAPVAVVAADLLLSPDARASRAGRDALRKALK